MSINDSTLRDIINYDPLASVEKLTGKSYKEDGATMALGLIAHLDNVKVKEQALAEADDNSYSSSLEDFLRIIKGERFEEALKVPFHYAEYDHPDTLFVFWHSDGILLNFDTFRGNRVNGGKFHYNFRPFDSNTYDWHSSGGFYDDGNGGSIWAGYHSCHEAIRLNLRTLRANGEFLPVWVHQPFLWLLHYADTKDPGYDYKAINAKRIALLPDHVQKAIAGSKP